MMAENFSKFAGQLLISKIQKNSSIRMLVRNNVMPTEIPNRAEIVCLCCKSIDYGTRLPRSESCLCPLVVW